MKYYVDKNNGYGTAKLPKWEEFKVEISGREYWFYWFASAWYFAEYWGINEVIDKNGKTITY